MSHFSAALHVSIVDSKDMFRSFKIDVPILDTQDRCPDLGYISRNMKFLQLSKKLQDLMSTLVVAENCSNVSPCWLFSIVEDKPLVTFIGFVRLSNFARNLPIGHNCQCRT